MKLKAIAISLLLFQCCVANAQLSGVDSANYHQALTSAKNTYLTFVGAEALIYNGPLFKPYNYTLAEGSQYFIPTQSPLGKVLYNGIMYANVPLLFDVLNNKLITTQTVSNQSFEIITDHVSYFELDNHKFFHLQNPPAKKMLAGFYEIHYEGKKSCVYEKHVKALNEELGEKYKKYVIEDNSIFYIKKDGKYQKVEKMKSLYRIYENHEAELKSFAKNTGLSLSKITVATLIKIAAYFDTL